MVIFKTQKKEFRSLIKTEYYVKYIKYLHRPTDQQLRYVNKGVATEYKSSCYSGNSIRGSNQPVNKTNNNDNIHIQFTAVNENTNYDGITIINIDKVEDIVENNNNKEKEDNDDDGDDSKINEIIEIISNS
ncbi:13175_t:CDS:2, partial [Entrophospora sp. SA101]